MKYISDSQAKSEWLHKQEQIERRKFEEESKKCWERTQKQLDYLSKLTGIAFEDIIFQDEKINDAGEILTKKNPKRV